MHCSRHSITEKIRKLCILGLMISMIKVLIRSGTNDIFLFAIDRMMFPKL